jgi:hypothetical protein
LTAFLLLISLLQPCLAAAVELLVLPAAMVDKLYNSFINDFETQLRKGNLSSLESLDSYFTFDFMYGFAAEDFTAKSINLLS